MRYGETMAICYAVSNQRSEIWCQSFPFRFPASPKKNHCRSQILEAIIVVDVCEKIAVSISSKGDTASLDHDKCSSCMASTAGMLQRRTT